MTTNEIIGLTLLRISGGIPTSDMSVREWDIKSYIPAAINYAITQSYFTSIREEGDTELPSNFYSEYEDIAVLVDPKGKEYITLPVNIVPLVGNRGLRYVEDNCGNRYKPMPEGSSSCFSCYWGKVLGAIPYYQLNGKKVYLYNKPAMVETVNVGTVTNADGIDPDEQLPIPAGHEPSVIDIIATLFKDQRFTPKDYIIDGRDLFSRV